MQKWNAHRFKTITPRLEMPVFIGDQRIEIFSLLMFGQKNPLVFCNKVISKHR